MQYLPGSTTKDRRDSSLKVYLSRDDTSLDVIALFTNNGRRGMLEEKDFLRIDMALLFGVGLSTARLEFWSTCRLLGWIVRTHTCFNL